MYMGINIEMEENLKVLLYSRHICNDYLLEYLGFVK